MGFFTNNRSSRTTTNIFGDRKTTHYDKYGRKTGYTTYGKNIFGDKTSKHYDKNWNKTGSTTHYGSKSYSYKNKKSSFF